MYYLLALLLPPVAVLMVGKPIQALINVGLWCLFIVPGIIHALLVVSNYYADKRTGRIVKAVNKQTDVLRAQGITRPRQFTPAGRVACPQCGYTNSSGRRICKSCRWDLLIDPDTVPLVERRRLP